MNNHIRHTDSVTSKNIRSLHTLILSALVLTLIACSQNTNQNEITVSDDTLSAPLPSALLVVDATTLVIEVVADGGPLQNCANLTVDQEIGTYSCNITLSVGQHTISLIFTIIDADFGTVQVATASGINVDVVQGQTATADFFTALLTYNDDDNDGANNLNEILIGTNPFTSGDTAGVDPVPPLTNSRTDVFNGIQLITESGFDGQIESDGFFLQLSIGTPSINVVNVQRIQASDISCTTEPSAIGTSSSDYLTGIVTHRLVINNQNVSCTSTFQTIIPVTISGEQSIAALLIDWGSDTNLTNAAQSGLIATTCPSSLINLEESDVLTQGCNGELLTNYIITDSGGGVHVLSLKNSF